MVARIVMLLAALLVTGSPALARSYYLDHIEVSAQLREDGSMRVRETREVVFKGSFRAFDRAIPLPAGTAIENISVSEQEEYERARSEAPGTFSAILTAGEARISWFYSATEAYPRRVFTLEYDIVGAVQKHADVAELYWQFIAPRHDWRANTSRVTVDLPAPVSGDDLLAWAHGPPWGELFLEESRVVLVCDPLPRDEMVEARIVLPTELIAFSPRADNGAALPAILAEEDKWARDANAARTKAKALLVVRWALPALLAIAALWIWLALYLRYGREHRPATEITYLREPPDDWKPNEVALLWRWGHLGPADLTATLMDLVRRGALKLIVSTETRPRLGGLLGEAIEQEYTVERVRDYDGELGESERYLISRVLFHEVPGDRVTLDEFQKKARQNPTSSRARFKNWEGMAKAEAKRMEVVDPASKRAFGASIAMGLILFAGSIALGAALQSPAFLATGVVGFALIPGSFAILRRTREAAEALHRWQAFRRYLTDFSRLKEYPPPAVILWEQYLVYAITLGVADEVIEQFKELYPQAAATAPAAGFPHWVSSGGTPLSGMQSIGSVLSSFSSTLATATSSFSSSSGSGGGFSGGGGGGGGGGSSGAR